MSTILIQPDVKGPEKFKNILKDLLPEFNLALSIEQVDSLDIEAVVIWHNVPEFLKSLPNLKLLIVCGSGVDHIIESPNIPHNIPLVRLVDPFLRNHVADYVVEQIFKQFFSEISYCGDIKILSEFLLQPNINKPKVGIMGLGLVGEATFNKLTDIGFDVVGWTKSPKNKRNDNNFIGNSELEEFSGECDVLVCQLPLTKETNGILNLDLFSKLPQGAYLINVGRGAHLNESDLLIALDNGKLSGACLDVFEVEPLPLDHSFHKHSKITITPHIAGCVSPEHQALYAADLITKYYNNQELTGVVNFHSNY